MKRSWVLWSGLLLGCMIGAAPVAQAAQAGQAGEFEIANAATTTPLVVIRYNQPKVHYQRQLYNAVSRAVAIKPDVVFEVVSFIPVSGDDDRDESVARRAQGQTSQLVADMNRMGIPRQRIRVTSEAAQDARQHEIYIYVD